MLFFLFFPLFLFALNLQIDYGNAKKPYEVLTLYDKNKFTCFDRNKTIICEFDKVPITPVFKNKSRYFSIIPKFEDKFRIYIRVKGNYKIFSFNDNLYNNPLITPFKLKKAKKWVIVVNEQFLSKEKNKGLNFYYHHTYLPYVGAIDENLRPVNTQISKDVIKFFEILNSYKKGLDVLNEIDNFVKKYPKSIFIPDILYLKLKILDKENRSEDVISLGKKWIKEYAFNPKLPEVLLLIGSNYSKMGFLSEASYYFNRIITDYPNTKWAYLATIYLADQLYTTGDDKKALNLYKDVLYSTTDLDIASLAASRLAQRYIDKGEIKKAIEYYKKIYKANKKFILKDKIKAYELANMLASHKIYDLAINIGEDLIKRLKKLDDLYEPLLYKLAVWSYENKDYKKSLYFIDRYLKEFPYGDYSDNAKSLRDKILFNLPESNLTKKLNQIEKIIKNYEGEIKQKAIVKKARILFKLKKYDEILKMEDLLNKIPDNIFPDKKEFLLKVKKEALKELLKNKECFKAIKLLKKYKIILDKKWDEEIYNCAMRTKNYEIASRVCNKYLNDPNDEVFIKWMQRKIEALWGMRDYKNLSLAVDDLCSVKKTKCYKYLKYKFFALWNLGEYKKALKVAKELEKFNNFENVDVFIKIVNYALNNKDNLLAATYAKKIIELQNRYKAYPYSPFVDFTFAKYTENRQEAIKVLKDLLNRVKGEDKARAYFMLANLTKDKKYLKECLKIKNSTLWKGLCRDAMDLF
ncbi:tetratricopeptide repeat protein [Caminibacter mediatlanticus]|uniref:tetratricopeptide repeat protein n=1 Tax=Caminibacter mediatlanticus TaxID=291048 RepID=UPI001FD10AB6|nr:tetratricopeptide repeat protein [Caminibacter mediatlanticus]